MAVKGQKFKPYSDEWKKEAIRLHLEEKWTYRQITEHLEIHDKNRVKKWMLEYVIIAFIYPQSRTFGTVKLWPATSATVMTILLC